MAIDTAHHLHTVTHSVGTDTVNTLTVGNDDFAVSGGSLTINSTASFAHRLTVSGGTLTIGGAGTAANFSQSGGTVAGAANLTIDSATFGAGNTNLVWLQTGAGATVLTGDSTFDQGAFYLDGGRILENQGLLTVAGGGIEMGHNPFGTTLGGGSIENDVGATFRIQGGLSIYRTGLAPDASFTNAGTLEVTRFADIHVNFINTGAVLVTAGATLVLTGGSSSASDLTVETGSALWFDGGFSLGAGTIGGGGTVAVAGGNLAVAGDTTVGAFSQWDGIVSGTGTLTVGPATFGLVNYSQASWLQTGSGRTVITGNSTFVGSGQFLFCLDGGRILENQGLFTLPANAGLLLGYNPFGTSLGGGSIENDVGGTIDLKGSISSISGGSFINAGTLEKTAGTSVVGVKITNTGLIEAVSGTLDLTGEIAGDGAMRVDAGAILQVDRSAAASLSMTFNGANATLALGRMATFGATIGGFAAGDTIHLLRRTATAATLGPSDTLVITNNGVTVLTLQLTGDYSAATFNISGDGQKKLGVLISVTMPGAVANVPSHAFIAAMAGLGAGGGAVEAMDHARLDAYRPMLSSPRMHLA